MTVQRQSDAPAAPPLGSSWEDGGAENEEPARETAELLVVLSGPSGVGKDTLIRTVKASGFDIHYVVTATTRPPRRGEVTGRDYYFVGDAEFDGMIARNELLEYADVHGRRYGTPVSEVRNAFARGEDALLKIDVQGGLQVRRRIPQAVFVFLAPPSLEDLLLRLNRRHTESVEELEHRTRDAHFEMAQRDAYDYVIVNHEDHVDQAAEQLKCIITAEKLRIHRQPIEL
ncbi:MAG TPA: guanylate kinase [Chloroflexota bacterium]|nr:guanylate kinase [Chloroflexota bacterium]